MAQFRAQEDHRRARRRGQSSMRREARDAAAAAARRHRIRAADRLREHREPAARALRRRARARWRSVCRSARAAARLIAAAADRVAPARALRRPRRPVRRALDAAADHRRCCRPRWRRRCRSHSARRCCCSPPSLTLGTGLLFGLFPALHSTRPDLVSTLKGQAGQPSGARGAARFRLVARHRADRALDGAARGGRVLRQEPAERQPRRSRRRRSTT